MILPSLPLLQEFALVEVAESSTVVPLTVPDLAVVETPYDMFERNRQKLIAELESGNHAQAYGAWKDESTGARCILQLAHDLTQ